MINTVAFAVRHSLSGELKGELLKILSYLELCGKKIILTKAAKRLLRNKESIEEKEELSDRNISSIDLLVFFGGDGTLLKTLHLFAPEIFNVPIFGINAGNLGFFSSVSPKDKEAAFDYIFQGNVNLDARMIAKASIYNEEGESVNEFYALNEVTIHHSGIARLRKIKVSVGNDFLTTYKSDGLIISTPTGSTAYNLAAGGPIVSPQIPAFIITPLAPSGFSQRSIIVSSSKILSFSADSEMNISIDGQEYFLLKKHQKVEIAQYPLPLSFYRLQKEGYYKNLREKLGWGSE